MSIIPAASSVLEQNNQITLKEDGNAYQEGNHVSFQLQFKKKMRDVYGLKFNFTYCMEN